jgi:DNA-binding HxlR family transcriptional regulator
VRRTSFSEWPCSIARTVDLLGDWWTPLVLREAFYGVRRFEGFERGLGIGRNVLTQRLTRLVEERILVRTLYQERPARYEYTLTDKGRDLFDVLAVINAWGDRWIAPDGAPVLLHHTTCDHDTRAMVVCEHCRHPLEARAVRARLGPGYPAALRPGALASGRFSYGNDQDPEDGRSPHVN